MFKDLIEKLVKKNRFIGKSSCSIGVIHLHSWWIFQPVMLVLRGVGHFAGVNFGDVSQKRLG